MHTIPSADSRRDRRIAVALALFALIVYGLTMCRTIYTGDDGDFLTAMATFGVPHPTGYPLFILLGQLFLEALAPVVAEPAVRVNLMTALFGAGAVGFFYRFAAQSIGDRVWAAAASLFLAFAPTLWQQSLSCEVYSLNAFFLCAALYLATAWHQGRQSNTLCALAAVYGLALTNNLGMALLLPAFVVFVLVREPSLLRQGATLGRLVGCFCLPLTLYAYLPLATAQSDSPVHWGQPDSLERFWYHVSGALYRTSMFSQPLALWPARLAEYGGRLHNEFGLWSLWLAPVGLVALWRAGGTRRSLAALSLAVYLITVVYATNYEIFDIYVYFLPSYIAVAFWMAAGGAALWERAQRFGSEADRARRAPLLAAVLLTLPVVQMSLHYAATDKSGNFLEADFARNILKSVPQNAVVVATNHLTFTLWYEKWVRHQRPDVTVFNANLFHMNLTGQCLWYEAHLKKQWPQMPSIGRDLRPDRKRVEDALCLVDLLRAAMAQGRPVFYIERVPPQTGWSVAGSREKALTAAFDRAPWGALERLYPKGELPSAAEIVAQNERIWPTYSTRGLFTGWAQNDPLQQYLVFAYADRLRDLGTLAEQAGRYETARTAYSQFLQLFLSDDVQAGLARCEAALQGAP